MSTTRGILIGRFQPFHDGHRQLVEHIVGEVDELIVGIGSADVSHERRNPFTAGERIMMIRKSLEHMEQTVYTVPIEDLNRNSVWVSHIKSMSPRFDVAYSNNPLVVRLFEEEGVEVKQTKMFDRDMLKGSQIREHMRNGNDWQSAVPEPAVDVIDEIDGIDRLRSVS